MRATTQDPADDNIFWNAVWNVAILVVLAVILLPLRHWGLLWEITRAFMVLWGILLLASSLVLVLQRVLRVEDDPPSDAYVLSNLAVGVVLLVAWGGYTALLIRGSAAGAAWWVAVLLHVAGVLAAHAAFSDVSAIYGGSLYRRVNLVVAMGAFALFAAWPPAARALFGWLA